MLSWVSVDLLTGGDIVDLPGIELSGPLACTIGQVESATVNLNLTESTNVDWLTATRPGARALIAYTGDQANPVVLWGGIVTQRVRPVGFSVPLGLQTPECYLDACYVGDYTATSVNQDTIVSDLMGFATGTNRIPFTLEHLPNASTFLQTLTYATADQVTVLSALQSLSAISGGPEWTIRWVWNTAARTIRPTFSYGARIGSAVVAGRMPNVTLELADLLDGSQLTEDYTTGFGANTVTAIGTPPQNATSGSVPSASATAADLSGRPLWAYNYQPNSTISDVTILADYAEQALSQMGDGSQSVGLVIANDLPGKRLGVDWFLGDDLGWLLGGTLAFPQAVSGVARCVGYQVDYATVTPSLKGMGL